MNNNDLSYFVVPNVRILPYRLNYRSSSLRIVFPIKIYNDIIILSLNSNLARSVTVTQTTPNVYV